MEAFGRFRSTLLDGFERHCEQFGLELGGLQAEVAGLRNNATRIKILEEENTYLRSRLESGGHSSTSGQHVSPNRVSFDGPDQLTRLEPGQDIPKELRCLVDDNPDLRSYVQRKSDDYEKLFHAHHMLLVKFRQLKSKVKAWEGNQNKNEVPSSADITTPKVSEAETNQPRNASHGSATKHALSHPLAVSTRNQSRQSYPLSPAALDLNNPHPKPALGETTKQAMISLQQPNVPSQNIPATPQYRSTSSAAGPESPDSPVFVSERPVKRRRLRSPNPTSHALANYGHTRATEAMLPVSLKREPTLVGLPYTQKSLHHPPDSLDLDEIDRPFGTPTKTRLYELYGRPQSFSKQDQGPRRVDHVGQELSIPSAHLTSATYPDTVLSARLTNPRPVHDSLPLFDSNMRTANTTRMEQHTRHNRSEGQRQGNAFGSPRGSRENTTTGYGLMKPPSVPSPYVNTPYGNFRTSYERTSVYDPGLSDGGHIVKTPQEVSSTGAEDANARADVTREYGSNHKKSRDVDQRQAKPPQAAPIKTSGLQQYAHLEEVQTLKRQTIPSTPRRIPKEKLYNSPFGDRALASENGMREGQDLERRRTPLGALPNAINRNLLGTPEYREVERIMRTRTQPKKKLTLADFKINASGNQGLDFAYIEVVRKKAERKCLPNCSKEECCGGLFRGIAASKVVVPSADRHFWEDSVSDEQAQRRFLEHHLGDDEYEWRIRNMGREELEKVFIEVLAEKLAAEYGKHRQAHDRPRSPPGYWRADMATTQEDREDREAAQRIDREKIERRLKEARRSGGRFTLRENQASRH